MTDYPQNPYSGQSPQFGKQPMYPAESVSQTNSMGLAGFIVSIVGILTCGAISIFGVLLSAIGLMKAPRGFAIAGLMLGCAGLVMLAGVILLMFSGTRAFTLAVNSGMTLIQLKDSADRIGRAWETEGKLPTQEEGDRLLKNKNDPWNQRIVYETDGKSFSVRSLGPDRTANTDDDLVEGPFDNAQEARAFDTEDSRGGFEVEPVDKDPDSSARSSGDKDPSDDSDSSDSDSSDSDSSDSDW